MRVSADHNSRAIPEAPYSNVSLELITKITSAPLRPLPQPAAATTSEPTRPGIQSIGPTTKSNRPYNGPTAPTTALERPEESYPGVYQPPVVDPAHIIARFKSGPIAVGPPAPYAPAEPLSMDDVPTRSRRSLELPSQSFYRRSLENRTISQNLGPPSPLVPKPAPPSPAPGNVKLIDHLDIRFARPGLPNGSSPTPPTTTTNQHSQAQRPAPPTLPTGILGASVKSSPPMLSPSLPSRAPAPAPPSFQMSAALLRSADVAAVTATPSKRSIAVSASAVTVPPGAVGRVPPGMVATSPHDVVLLASEPERAKVPQQVSLRQQLNTHSPILQRRTITWNGGHAYFTPPQQIVDRNSTTLSGPDRSAYRRPERERTLVKKSSVSPSPLPSDSPMMRGAGVDARAATSPPSFSGKASARPKPRVSLLSCFEALFKNKSGRNAREPEGRRSIPPPVASPVPISY